jgi:hypothetical protein
MRGSAASGIMSMVASTILMCGCSGDNPIPTGPVSTPNGGKAAFNEAKAIEKIYHAGYTNISLTRRDPDGVWRGQATRRGSGAPTVVSVAEEGPVTAR